jgi:hypothetical protein
MTNSPPRSDGAVPTASSPTSTPNPATPPRLPLTCYSCKRVEEPGETFAPVFPLQPGAKTLVTCPEHAPSERVPSAAIGDHDAPTEPRTDFARELATGARRGELEDGTTCAVGRVACWDCGHGLSIDQWSRTVPGEEQAAPVWLPRPVGGGVRLVAVLLDVVRPMSPGPDGAPRSERITLAIGRAHGPAWGATVILDSRTSRDWSGTLTQAELEAAEELLYRERVRLIACETVADRQGRPS